MNAIIQEFYQQSRGRRFARWFGAAFAWVVLSPLCFLLLFIMGVIDTQRLGATLEEIGRRLQRVR